MTPETIREAIKHLPEDERRKLAGWFEGMAEAAWDEDLRRDFAPGGKGERLAKEIQKEVSESKARPLEEGLAKRRRSRVTLHSLALPRFWEKCRWLFLY
jgi:hypothetical protein